MFGTHRIKKLHKTTSNKKRHRSLDLLVYSGLIFGPLVTIPQIYIIWAQKNTAGVSLVSWSGYLVGSAVLFVYGIVYAELPIAVTNGVWIILNAMVVLGLILFR